MRTPTPDEYAKLGLQLRPAGAGESAPFTIYDNTEPHDWWFVNGMSRNGRVTRFANGRDHLAELAAQTAMSLVVFMLACDAVMSTLASDAVASDLDAWFADPMAFEAIPDRYYERAAEQPLFATLSAPDLSLDELIDLLDGALKRNAWVTDAVNGDLTAFKTTMSTSGTERTR